jgi:geranylgeranyl pyrophosphate synthase
MTTATTIDEASASVIDALGFPDEMMALRERLAAWVQTTDDEMVEMMDWQFGAGSKYFRPLTIFACHRATLGDAPIPPNVMTSAMVIEFFHNMTLVIDDILDKSPERRGKPTLHTKFGELEALMASGYIVAEGYLQLGTDTDAIALFSELVKRLGVAECMQWRLRRQPLGYEDWLRIAGEDTGSMFEICACLGDRSGDLRTYGGLLGKLYHGCDDVADVRDLPALGGGGTEDLRDGILTLPASLAIADDTVRAAFCKANPTDADLELTKQAFLEALPEAEARLDQIADQAIHEARLFSRNPEPLIALVAKTRELSGR